MFACDIHVSVSCSTASVRISGIQHSVHSLPRYPSSKPDQKPVMPSVSEHKYNTYSPAPVQLHSFSSPTPTSTESAYKLGQDSFVPNPTSVDQDRNGNTQIGPNGEYIHVSPSKLNYYSGNSQQRPDLCSTFRSPEHENPYSCRGFSGGHQGQAQPSKFNANLNGSARSSQDAEACLDAGNPACQGPEINLTSFSKYPGTAGNYSMQNPRTGSAVAAAAGGDLTGPPAAGTSKTYTRTMTGNPGSRGYTVDAHELCTEIDELFFKNAAA